MHEILREYYQKLKKNGFEYAGMIEDADIIMSSFGAFSPVCGSPDDFVNMHIRLDNDIIADIKYQCISDPTTNVAIEIICALAKGKTLQDLLQFNDDAALHYLGCEDELLQSKTAALLDLLRKEIFSYQKT